MAFQLPKKAAPAAETTIRYQAYPGSPISFPINNTKKLRPDVLGFYAFDNDEEEAILKYHADFGRIQVVIPGSEAAAEAEK